MNLPFSGQMYQSIFSADRQGILLLDAESLQVLEANPAVLKGYEYSRDELLAMTAADLTAEQDRATLLQACRKALVAEEANCDCRQLSKSGTVRDVRIHLRAGEDQGRRVIMAFVRDLREWNRHMAFLYRTQAILDAVCFASEQFLKAPAWEQVIHDVLARLGQAAGVSRVHVFQNHSGPAGAALSSRRFEWAAPGVSPQVDNPADINRPWRGGGMERWAEVLGRGEALFGHVRDFPQSERDLLEPKEIKSVAVVPIVVRDYWWGFLKFDECRTEREWSPTDLNALKSAASSLGAAIRRKRDESVLREREELYRTLAESAEDAIYVIDRSRNVAYLNGYAARMLRRPADEVVGKPLTAFFPSESLVGAQENVQEVFQTGRAVNARRILPFPEGQRWLDTRLVPVLDAAGRVSAVMGISRDITESKAAEDRLRLAEAQYRTLVEQIPAITYTAALDAASTTLYVSPQVGKLLGYTPDQYAKDPDIWRKALHPEDRDRVLAEVARSHETGRPFVCEYRMVARDGRVVWVRDEAAIVRDAAGKPLFIHGVMLDITESRRAEEALRKAHAELEKRVAERTAELRESNVLLQREISVRQQAEAELRYQAGLLSNVLDPVVSTDAEHRIRTWNEAAEAVYGWAAADVIGKHLDAILSTALPPGAGERADDRLVSKGSWRGEVVQSRKDGGLVHVLVSGSIVRDSEGKPVGFVFLYRDITARKQAEEALRRRDAILEAVGFSAERFLGPTDWEQSVHDVLERLGLATGGSRVYIFQRDPVQAGGTVVSLRYEWTAPGIAPQIPRAEHQSLPLEERGFSRWASTLRQGHIIHGHVRECPESERIRLAEADIKSIVGVPIFVEEEWWGFIGIDECAAERRWTTAEVDALKIASDIIGAAIQRRRVLEALSQTNEKLRTIIQASPVAIMALDAHGRIAMWSPAAERIFGWSAEEVVGRPNPIVPESKRAEADRNIRRVFQGESLVGLEVRRMRRGGTMVDISLSSAPLCDSTGRVTGIMGVVMDITERKRAETALRAAEEKYRLLIENAGCPIFVVDEQGVFHVMNNIAAAYLGGEPADFVGKRMGDLFPKAVAKWQMANVHKVIKSGEPFADEAPTILQGRNYWFKTTIQPFPDPGGFRAVQIITHDVTDRVRREREQAFLLEIVRNVLERRDSRTVIGRVLKHCMAATYSEFGLFCFYDAAKERFAADPVVSAPKSWDLPSPLAIPPSEEGLSRVAVAEKRHIICNDLANEPRADIPPGPPALRNLLLLPVQVRHSVTGLFALGNTREKYLEEDALQLMGFLNQAALAVEHVRVQDERERLQRMLEDLNKQILKVQEDERGRLSRELHDGVGQEITAVVLALQGVRAEPMSGAARDHLDRATVQVRQVMDEVRRLSHRLRPAVLDDFGLIAALRREAKEFSALTRIPVTLRLPKESEISLESGEETAMFRIVQESLTNVAKHAHASKVSLEMRCGEGDIQLVIADDGRGFSTEKLGRDPEHPQLGLRSIRERVKALGGAVDILSKIGKGTKLVIRIPRKKKPDA